MKKVIPNMKVADMGVFTRDDVRAMSLERKIELGLIMSNGELNDYRYYQIIGQGGSYKEYSWNRKRHQHDCCGSKVAWRHKTGCRPEVEEWPDDLSDLSDEPLRSAYN